MSQSHDSLISPQYVSNCACAKMEAVESLRITGFVKKQWESIPVGSQELNLHLTLSSGQAFRWVQVEEEEGEGVWAGTIGEK